MTDVSGLTLLHPASALCAQFLLFYNKGLLFNRGNAVDFVESFVLIKGDSASPS